LVFGREHDGIPPEAEELLHEAFGGAVRPWTVENGIDWGWI
jgi:hypothetical protein